MAKTTNDLKKGTRVLLNYGEQNGDIVTCNDFKTWLLLLHTGASYKSWEAELLDNKKGNIRLMKVFGWEEDIGDTYAWKIIAWLNTETGFWEPVEYTPAQLKNKEMVEGMGF